jgi:hypothetical protein
MLNFYWIEKKFGQENLHLAGNPGYFSFGNLKILLEFWKNFSGKPGKVRENDFRKSLRTLRK